MAHLTAWENAAEIPIRGWSLRILPPSNQNRSHSGMNQITPASTFFPRDGFPPVQWRIEKGLTPYDAALSVMEARADAIRAGTADELVWLVEHPPLYTAGTSAD